MTKQISRTQVPNSLIIDWNISHEEFLLYTILKLHLITKEKIVTIIGRDLKSALGWKDTRTLKKYLLSLDKKGCIKILNNFRVNSKCRIYVECYEDEPFTQVATHKVHKILHGAQSVQHRGEIRDMRAPCIRLFYYYEKNYNYDLEKSFPSYEKISEDLGMDSSYISSLNSHLEKKGEIRIEKGRYYSTKDGKGNQIVRRHVNNYFPNSRRKE